MNSETISTCSQHVQFTYINSQEFHACISYMPAHMLGNDVHVRAMKIISIYLDASMYFLQLLIRENIGRACVFIYCPRWYSAKDIFCL